MNADFARPALSWRLLALATVLLCAGVAWAETEKVCVIKVTGAIGPSTATYIERAIDEASFRGAQCLIIELDTPGGLLESTKLIVMKLLASPVPTIVYVAPPGATAGSAGCFITLAADIAAMAPTTNIGAAHPVSMGGGGEEKLDDTMKKKLENYATSYIETIAAKRKRNVEWAKSSVRDSSAITAETALASNVVEIVAQDLPDLLRQLDGREVNGHKLRTADAQVVELPMAMRERVFQMIWRPEVMFLLMLVAIYGIIGELSNPGAVLPGVAGGIAVVLLLYMASILPVNIAGLALIGFAIALFVTDVFAPTHGVLTGGGVIAFFLGSLMLFDRLDPVYRLSIAFILPATLLTAAFFVFVVGSGLRAQLLPTKVGKEAMVGRAARVVTAVDAQRGKVFVEGEYWNAVSDEPIAAEQAVEIVAVEGLKLKVRRKTA